MYGCVVNIGRRYLVVESVCHFRVHQIVQDLAAMAVSLGLEYLHALGRLPPVFDQRAGTRKDPFPQWECLRVLDAKLGGLAMIRKMMIAESGRTVPLSR